MTASQYGMEPNDFAKAVDEGGQIPAMVAEVARRKALATVLEKAKVVDADGNEVDLNALNTGEDAASEATRVTTTRVTTTRVTTTRATTTRATTTPEQPR